VGTALRVPPPEALDRSLVEPPGVARADGGNAPSPTSVPARTRAATAAKNAGENPAEIELALPVSAPPDDASRLSPRTRDEQAISRVETTFPRYQVKAHDTLRSIARDTLGDSRRADEILEMNKDTIPDPKRLTTGQMLYLPDDARLASGKR